MTPETAQLQQLEGEQVHKKTAQKPSKPFSRDALESLWTI